MSDALTILLASAFKVAHAKDAAAQRAADKATEHLADSPILDFDVTELRVLSQEAREAAKGTHYVAAPETCTCKGGHHPWCKHRVEYRVKLAELALTDPAALLRMVREQIAMTDDGDAEIAPATGAAVVIADITGESTEMSDAEYLAIVAEQGPPPTPADEWEGYAARPGEPWAPDYITELWP